MKIKLNSILIILISLVLLTSCNENNFEVVTNENAILSQEEMLNSEILNQKLDFFPAAVEIGYVETLEDRKYRQQQKINFLKEKLKVVKSNFTVKNNSNQIIETCNLTVMIKFLFDNNKEFYYHKNYNVLSKNKVWKKNETLDLKLLDAINFSMYFEKKLFKIHEPEKVIINYYINASNSLGYSSVTKNIDNKEVENEIVEESVLEIAEEAAVVGSEQEDWSFDKEEYEKLFGKFVTNSISKNEIVYFGEKIYEEDITDLYNSLPKINNNHQTNNRELNDSFVNKGELKNNSEDNFIKEKSKLLSEGWKDAEIQNGQLPSCYNFIPAVGKIENNLDVFVGSGTDVSIKIMNIKTEKCIRYVFINSGSSYKIENIPEGIYYLKIAYGTNWLSKVENGQCKGRFVRNAIYEKGKDFLNFYVQKTVNGVSIPSYKLSLDVISNNVSNSFNSQDISETEFNK